MKEAWQKTENRNCRLFSYENNARLLCIYFKFRKHQQIKKNALSVCIG
jgi:hypothetical protein